MTAGSAAAAGLGALLAAFTLIWIASIRRRDVSIVDIFWGPGFVLAGWLYVLLLDGLEWRRLVVAALVTAWGLRLALHIWRRHRGKGEDPFTALVTLVTRARVTRLETDPSGRSVSRVIVEREGVREEYRADVVVVAAGAINSAALLLRSADDHHPTGLANRSGVVGRHYMCHVNSMFLAISRHANPTRLNKTLGLNDFYFAGKDWEFPMGHVSLMGNVDGNVLAPPGGGPDAPPVVTIKWTADDFARAGEGQLPTGKATEEWTYGDLEAGFKNAALVLDETFVVQATSHQPIADSR